MEDKEYILTCFSKAFGNVVFSDIPQYKYLKDKGRVYTQKNLKGIIQTSVRNKDGYELVNTEVEIYGWCVELPKYTMMEIYDIVNFKYNINTNKKFIKLTSKILNGEAIPFARELEERKCEDLTTFFEVIIRTHFCKCVEELIIKQGFSYDKNQVLHIDSECCFRVIENIMRDNSSNCNFKVYLRFALVNEGF